jgi:hypothetical protein
MAPPQSIPWSSDRAILLVHGVGNARPGDYADLVRQLDDLLGPEAKDFAIYMFYYDQFNDWFVAKQQVAFQLGRLLQETRGLLANTDLGAKDPVSLANAIAEIVGDVIWPILLADARNAIRMALIAQITQMVSDGHANGVEPRDQQLTIIAHSMGCFHVYETLQTICADFGLTIGPVSGGVRFKNVIFMASPVQLIRTIGSRLGALVPQRESIRSITQPLSIPSQASATTSKSVAKRTIAIAGNLDPVAGFFFRVKPAWSYMNLPGQEPVVDAQALAQVDGSDEISLTQVLRTALVEHSAPVIQPNNPHSWSAYVSRHAKDLADWLLLA